jgi:hypothetical protein
MSGLSFAISDDLAAAEIRARSCVTEPPPAAGMLDLDTAPSLCA